MVFDAKGKTFRDDWYPQYKAHRPPMPDDLVRQIEPIHAASGRRLAALADGRRRGPTTSSAPCRHPGCRHAAGTLISTGDKDLAQLVSPTYAGSTP